MDQFISMATTILEQCQVTPSSGSPSELLLPLTYCDVPCLPLTPLEHLIFYAFPCSHSHFSQTIVPQLKHSLSHTLKHFPPLAGNIIFPLSSESAIPVSRYVAGDSISLTIALSDADLSLLAAKNLSRDADQFHHLVARFGPASYSPDFIQFAIAAIQATLFPEQGICIGITTHHAIADGSTILHFVAVWSSIAKFKGDDSHLLATNLLPSYDRSRVQDVDSLTKSCWDLIKMSSPMVSSINFSPTNKVRATFVLTEAQLRKLNDSVVEKKPPLAHLSSFAILCAHVWTCLARSAGEGVGDDEPEYMVCPADIRGRLNPPLPHTYFGNCLALSIAESTHGRLKGEQGIFVAAVAIWEAIQKTVINEKGILDGFMNRLLVLDRVERAGTNRVLWISGSPRFDVYVADLGWGSPESYELVNSDSTGSVFLAKSKEFEGGVEIILSRPKAEMDAFAAIFKQSLAPSTTVNHVSKL